VLYLRAAFTSDSLSVSLVLHFPAVTSSPLQHPFPSGASVTLVSLPLPHPPPKRPLNPINRTCTPLLHLLQKAKKENNVQRKRLQLPLLWLVCCSGRTGKANWPFICRAGLNPGSTALDIGGCLNLWPSIYFRHLNSRAQKKPTQANTVEWTWLPLFSCRIDEKDVCDVRLIYSHSPSPRLLD